MFFGCFSFVAGDVFVIEDNVNESWYWGQLRRTGEKGLIPKAYLNDAVSKHLFKPRQHYATHTVGLTLLHQILEENFK